MYFYLKTLKNCKFTILIEVKITPHYVTLRKCVYLPQNCIKYVKLLKSLKI